jgi:hypothetical protein
MGGTDAGGQSPADVVEELLRSCAGQIADVGGTVVIRVGAPGLPVKFITDDDILIDAPQEYDPFPGAEESWNVVHATWVNPGRLWTVKEATPKRDEDAIDVEGQELVANLALPAVTNGQQVQQLMAAWLKDARRHRRHSITLPPEGILLNPLDTIDWTSARNGYSGKAFEIGQVGIDTMSLCTTLALREVDPADYDWEVGDEIAVDAPSIEKVEPAAQSVPGFDATEATIKDGTGADRRPAIRLEWSAPLPGVSAIRFQIRVMSGAVVAVEGSTANVDQGYHVVSEGIVANVQYQARARLVGPKKTVWTAWVTVAAPDVKLTSADIEGGVEQLLSDAGMTGVEIVNSLPATGNFEGRTVYLTTDGKLYRWDGSQWTAAVETVDLVGTIVADEVADGAITTAAFATGIAPVEIVATLPATGNFAGRTVFLTTDSKTYRHTGSPSGSAGFTAAVPAVDVTGQLTDAQIAAISAVKLTGQITSTQITDDAITTPKIAVGAVTAAEITAGAITTEKIAAGAVTAATIDAGAITATKIAADAITADKIAANAITAGAVAAGAISTSELAAGAVNADKIAAGAITTEKIAANAVTAGTIAADAVTSAKIAANAVTAGKIAADAITAGVVAAGAISGDLGHIASLSVDTLQIKGQAITVAARTWRPEKVTISNPSSWSRRASLSLTRVAGFQTELRVNFAYSGTGTAVVIGRLMRGSTQIATAAFTTGERGSQMQGSWVFVDTNTAAGSTPTTSSSSAAPGPETLSTSISGTSG